MRPLPSLTLVLLGALACDGPAGPAGPVGPVGPGGSTNVVSGLFTVAPAAWTNGFWYFPIDGGTQGNPAKVTTVLVPAITADIVNDGATFVYLKVPATGTGASTHWTLLPFHQGGFGGGYLVSIKAAVQAGEIRLGYLHERTDTSVTTPDAYTATLPTYEFRYVAIAGVSASALVAYASDPDRVLAAARGNVW